MTVSGLHLTQLSNLSILPPCVESSLSNALRTEVRCRLIFYRFKYGVVSEAVADISIHTDLVSLDYARYLISMDVTGYNAGH